MEVHRRIVEIKSLEIVERSADCVFWHRRLKSLAELSKTQLILPQQDTLLEGIQEERLNLFILKHIRRNYEIVEIKQNENSHLDEHHARR